MFALQWIILLTLALPSVASCPKNLEKHVSSCMIPKKGHAAQVGPLALLQTGLDQTSKLCRDGSIQNTLDCLSRLYNRCAKTKEGVRHFDLVVDVNKWRDTMENICNKIHYLSDHAACEAKAKEEFKPCAIKEAEAFMAQKNSIQDEVSSYNHVSEDQRTEAVIAITCSFTEKIHNCLRGPYEKYCPEPMTSLLIETFKSFMPRPCANRVPGVGIQVVSNPRYNVPGGSVRGAQEEDPAVKYGKDKVKDYVHTDLVLGSPRSRDELFASRDRADDRMKDERGPEVGNDEASRAAKAQQRDVIGTAKGQQGHNSCEGVQSKLWTGLIAFILTCLKMFKN
ncbi:unnamed protein product [Lymnaea stagnalis]|uniref:Uncharacterized protein n=1 Tax=Lymnaea stagnalis TaxID=6523 RepID=A0AAV2IML8_LYMST